MGGDLAPAELVAGAAQAARQEGHRVLLVGDREAVESELSRHDISGLSITVAPSKGVIEEMDHPVRAIKVKPKASVAEAARLVKAGKAHAMVTMGSTGAAMASATLVIGLLEGVERPALGGPMFGELSKAVLVDVGSSVDCRPSQLLGFGALGAAFARSIQKVENPRVGLFSVGAEEGKGNRQIRETFPVFKASGLNFVGNVEGMDFFLDKADVVVCDGFVGNVLMKFAEGLGMALIRLMPKLLRRHLSPGALRQVAGELANMTVFAEVGGGGPLFGVDGVVIVGHGRARAASVVGAINLAHRLVDAGFVDAMRRELASLQG